MTADAPGSPDAMPSVRDRSKTLVAERACAGVNNSMVVAEIWGSLLPRKITAVRDHLGRGR
jgi:hypothetical protein